MPRDGSGIYSKASASFVANTTITSASVNADFDDLVSDANTARPITAGGTGAATGAGAVAGLGALSKAEMSFPAAGGSANALTLTPTTALAALASNQVYTFTVAAANTGAATLAVSGLAAKALRRMAGGADIALVSGDLQVGDRITVVYDATANSGSGAWVIVGKSASGPLANISSVNGGPLGGTRNRIINGNFDIWQRGTSQTLGGFRSDDRWWNATSGTTKVHSQQAFTPGQTDVTGNPIYFSRTVVTSVAGATNYCRKDQFIEDVNTCSGKVVTATFWAKADAAKNIGIEFYQYFGSGGSPSGLVSAIGAQQIALTTAWQKFSVVFTVPSIAGKTVGTNSDHYLGWAFWFDAGSSFATRASNIGQQSGTFDLARVSLVEGDASKETDPFSPRPIALELALCQRYYEKSFDMAVAPAQNTNVTGGALSFVCQVTSQPVDSNVAFKVAKRAVPTLTTYSPNAAGSNWATNTDTPVAAVASNTLGMNGVAIRASTPLTAGRAYQIHWTADAEMA